MSTTILAIDTALSAASVCILQTGSPAPLVQETLTLQRGHDVHLPILLETALSVLPGKCAALNRIAVTVGPGSFTGLRVGLSMAQGMALARNIPLVGVSTLSAYAAPLIRSKSNGLILSAVDARHGRVFLEAFGVNGRSILSPRLVVVTEVMELILGKPKMSSPSQVDPLYLVGSGAPLLAIEAWSAGLKAEVVGDLVAPDIAYVARLGLLADPATAPARPLYLKQVDAIKPQPSEFARA